jgi:hypothetical protein
VSDAEARSVARDGTVLGGYNLYPQHGAQSVDNVVAKPSLCRMVIYRGKQGRLAPRAAVVIGTQDSIMPEGIASGEVPALSSDRHVHLFVFTPGEAGHFTEYDVAPGDGPGEWSWPPRSA